MKTIKTIFFWIVIYPITTLAMIIHNSYRLWLYRKLLDQAVQILPEDGDQEGDDGENNSSDADAESK